MGFFVGIRWDELVTTRRFRPPRDDLLLGDFLGFFQKPKKSCRLGSHIREAPGSRIFVSRSFLSFLEKSPNILTKLTQPTMAHGFFKPPERSAEISLSRPGMSDAEYDGRSGSGKVIETKATTKYEIGGFNFVGS